MQDDAETITDMICWPWFDGFQVGALNGGGDTVVLTRRCSSRFHPCSETNQEDAVIDDRQYRFRFQAAQIIECELDGNQDVDLYVRAGQE